jgi:hypothetical protein
VGHVPPRVPVNDEGGNFTLRFSPQHAERAGLSPALQPQASPHLTAEQEAFAEVLGHLLAEAWRKQGQEATGNSYAMAQPIPRSSERAR